MRYDRGWGRSAGAGSYDRGYGMGDDRVGRVDPRPGVGGYRPGYEGGSGGIAMRTTGPLRNLPAYPARGAYDRPVVGRRPRRDRGFRGYALDYVRPEYYHPRYSPAAGTYAAMGGTMRYGRVPRPLADPERTSEWTHWF